MTDDRTRLSGMLNFAAEVLAARETVRFDMATGGGMVLREEAVAHLPGIHLGEDEAWMRVVRMRETPPSALPERFQDWLDGTSSHPDRPPATSERSYVGFATCSRPPKGKPKPCLRLQIRKLLIYL